jgi:acetyl esterase/lipase
MPRTIRPSKVLAVVVLAALLCSCAPDTVASPDGERLRPCAPAGAPPPNLPFPAAKTVAPSDLSTSVVQKVDRDAQIQCGSVKLTSIDDVVYSTPGGGPGALTLDVLTPATSGPKPLVVYVPGGGFVQADKGGALGLRTYVAESGYVVASIRYRTVTDGARYVDGLADVKSAVRFCARMPTSTASTRPRSSCGASPRAAIWPR